MSDHAADGADRVRFDAATADSVAGRWMAAADVVSALHEDFDRLAAQVDVAIGVGPAADAFRATVAPLLQATGDGLRSARDEIAAHSAALRHGRAELLDGDTRAGEVWHT
ncbi:hypothetical protein [Gordonia soli]|uniref:ESX-1 secretion-associated protein n=1 Tax=Gordonia soli NBRC 108243 TaxID=1223545 RepID=M0QK50_9ACTN|nr:hypothetical protein [Gordonia soli]GAC69005.1 hypothetical protein GS4_20_00700 [Gordonia soli NBRC 108243]